MSFVRKWIESISEFKAQQQKKMREDGAEMYIAKAYRTLVFRRKLKNLLYWHRYNCALRIQRVFLGYRVRKKFVKIFSLYKIQQAHKSACATKIQMMIRCHFARARLVEKALRKRKRNQERQQRKLYLLGATTQQMNLKWMIVKMYRNIVPNRMEILRRKAVVIQRYYRGHHGRKRAFIVGITNVIRNINKKHAIKMKAITKIQRSWRGYITRYVLVMPWP